MSDFFTQFTEIQMGKIVHIFERFSQTFFVLTKVSTVEYNQPTTRFVSTSMAMNFSCSSTQACQSKLQLIFLCNMATKLYIQLYIFYAISGYDSHQKPWDMRRENLIHREEITTLNHAYKYHLGGAVLEKVD